MSAEIRLLDDADLEQLHFVVAYSFGSDRSPEARLHHVEAMGPVFGSFEDGQLVACLRIYPLRMFMHGASIPLGGVSAVACLPEHRRKGYVGQLLQHSLQVMRELGQPVSTLYTPHPTLYRRYGWMYASSNVAYRFHPKDVSIPAPRSGRAHRADEEDWSTLADVYRRFAASRNGYMDRDERWWREAVFRDLYDARRQPRDVASWTGPNGETLGYVVYRTSRTQQLDRPDVTRLAVNELVAVDATAYRGLLRYVLSHDLVNEVIWQAPPYDPLLEAVDEPRRIACEQWPGFMLRVVDVEAAFAARPPAPNAPQGSFTVSLADAAAPWNHGAWRIECSGGRLAAARTSGEADLATDAAAFAAMCNGYLRPSEAVRAGLAEAGDPSAVLPDGPVGLADRILAVNYAPYDFGFF